MKLSCCCSLKFSILWQLILLIPQILTERLDNKIFSTLTLSDESEFVLEYDYHWETFPADIRKSFTLSLEDSFYGKQIQFIHERNVRNEDCVVSRCSYCHGTGHLTTKTINPSKSYQQVITTPCPKCLGLKYTANNCPIYSLFQEPITLDIPVGCLPGYHIPIEGKGNVVQIPGTDKFKTGKLYIDIDEVSTGPFNVTARGLELTVYMSPSEALEGFNRSYEIIPGRTLEINRQNKTTLPETEFILPGQGLPIANEPNVTSDLYVMFEFESDVEEPAETSTSEPIEIVASDEDILIRKQEDYDLRYKKSEKKRKDRLIKKILLNMKREMDRAKRRKQEFEERIKETRNRNQTLEEEVEEEGEDVNSENRTQEAKD